MLQIDVPVCIRMNVELIGPRSRQNKSVVKISTRTGNGQDAIDPDVAVFSDDQRIGKTAGGGPIAHFK